MYEINNAAVIGAGTMGLGIAGQLANCGVEVLLLDLPSAGKNRNAVCERAIERLLDETQPGLLHQKNLNRITVGNIEDDLHKLDKVDWIAEAVVERLDIKKDLYRRIDAVRKPGSIVSSNTSTIPISLLVEGMPESFQAEFAITHFFNPVRYMRLLELVQGEYTKQEVMDCLERFNEESMGKGIVVCQDTPGFLGNRVGVFAIQKALHTAFQMNLKPEEADAIFGRPMGIPKTGVFGLYDLIGIDLMNDVAKSLERILPERDVFHTVASEIPVMKRMINEGFIGNKGGKGGFYRQDNITAKETLDFDEFSYRPYNNDKPNIAIEAEIAGDFTRLLEGNDLHSIYAWEILSETLCYAASLVPEVNESLVAIDDAMKLGYNWIRGPFEMIDAIGTDQFVERLRKEGRNVPAFLATAVNKSFYRVLGDELQYLLADGRYRKLSRASGIARFSEKRRTLSSIYKNKCASYFILPDDIGLIEFHSKANTLDSHSMQLVEAAVSHASNQCRTLIIHNDAQHFSCGVNLEGVLDFIHREDFDGIDQFLHHFQQTCLSLRDSPIPVIAAPSGLSLGGGYEVVLHADKVIYHANSVTGLVESLVGVVPGGGGVKEILYRWIEEENNVEQGAWQAFMNIGYGKTARSPLEAAELCMFRSGIDDYVMNRDRLLYSAIRIGNAIKEDYVPRSRKKVAVAGPQVFEKMVAWLENAHHKGHLTPHDVTTGSQIAMIVTGGDIAQGIEVTEQHFLDLERKAFVHLAQTVETRARIKHMLEYGSPLRN
ncbi:MAG: acetoacetyl-CoA reductase [Woeseia sp.]|nr:acetoacetyl-CoA reductase [Woeseia sp.]|tara:strand:- start:246 stop:2561 length:2316 start_codon:yes stop_codon:yes gene_type:complete